MANSQAPPATTQSPGKVVNAGTAQLSSIRVNWSQDIEAPPSFGASQQSIEADLTCG